MSTIFVVQCRWVVNLVIVLWMYQHAEIIFNMQILPVDVRILPFDNRSCQAGNVTLNITLLEEITHCFTFIDNI